MSRGFVASNALQHFADASEQVVIDDMVRNAAGEQVRLAQLGLRLLQLQREDEEIAAWERRLDRITWGLIAVAVPLLVLFIGFAIANARS